jgi:hypothetical protein
VTWSERPVRHQDRLSRVTLPAEEDITDEGRARWQVAEDAREGRALDLVERGKLAGLSGVRTDAGT